jgi:hypothetical protein
MILTYRSLITTLYVILLNQAIGEEFVEFLENELKIDDSNSEGNTANDPYTWFGGQTKNARDDKTSANSFDDGVSEIEAALVKLKKELGLG